MAGPGGLSLLAPLGIVLFAIGVGVAGLTALYMFRAIFITFLGDYRGGEASSHGSSDDAPASAPHESPPSMWVPLAILAVPAVAIGWLNIGGGFGEFVEGALPAEMRHFEFESDPVVLVSSTLAAFGGIGAGGWYHRWVASGGGPPCPSRSSDDDPTGSSVPGSGTIPAPDTRTCGLKACPGTSWPWT